MSRDYSNLDFVAEHTYNNSLYTFNIWKAAAGVAVTKEYPLVYPNRQNRDLAVPRG